MNLYTFNIHPDRKASHSIMLGKGELQIVIVFTVN